MCTNKHVNDDECMEWAADDQCKDNPDWMLANCRKACGQCRVVTPGKELNNNPPPSAAAPLSQRPPSALPPHPPFFSSSSSSRQKSTVHVNRCHLVYMTLHFFIFAMKFHCLVASLPFTVLYVCRCFIHPQIC